jgi:hypothetical protein
VTVQIKRAFGGKGGMRADRVGWIGFGTVTLFALAVVLPFVQPFNDYVFEPDTQIETIGYYQSFLSTLDPKSLPHLTSAAPYFDGPFVFYALISFAAHALSVIGVISSKLDGARELNIFTLKYSNAVLHAFAIGLMFLSAYRLSRSTIAGVLAALAFASCRQIYLIDLLRIDQFILPLLILLVFFSIVLLQDGPSRCRGVLVGCCVGAYLTCKISGLYVVIFPALAVAIRSPSLPGLFNAIY